MRFVPTLVHGVADYIVGIGMILLAFVSDAEEAGFGLRAWLEADPDHADPSRL
jgi:hypothetical protein